MARIGVAVACGIRAAGVGAVVFGIADAGRRADVNRRHIASLGCADLLTRQILAQTGGQQAQVARFRFFQQVVHRFRALGTEAIGIQRGQLRVEGPGHLAQRFQRVIQIVAGGDFGRQHGVIVRTGVLHVGDRHQAHVEALGGLIQRAVDRVFLRLGIGQRVDRFQHVEVSGGGVENQRLLCGLEGDVGDAGGLFLQRQLAPFRHVEEGLRQCQRTAGHVAVNAIAVTITVGVIVTCG